MAKENTDVPPAIKGELAVINRNADTLAIVDAKSMELGAGMLTALNKIGDKLKAEKEKITKPLNAALKEVRSRYKPAEDVLESAVASIRGKMSTYQTEQKKIADGQAAKLADKVSAGKLSPEKAIEKIAELDTPAGEVEVQGGSVQFRTVRKLKVSDEGLLLTWLYKHEPALLSWGEGDVLDLLKEGRQIDGAEIEEVQVPYNSR